MAGRRRTPAPWLAILVLAAGACVALAAPPARAGEVDVAARPPVTSSVRPARLPTAHRVTDAELWALGEQLEAIEQWLAAGLLYEEISRRRPEAALPRWRTARAYVIAGEQLPADAHPQPIALYEQAEVWAGQAMALAPECAECVLYKFAAVARQGTARGLVASAWRVREMGELLDRAFELEPTHRYGNGDHERANLFYAASRFYRGLPEWFWFQWATGYRGDKHRALDYARRAHAMSPARLDYAVELGATLLCVGELEEGRRVLSSVPAMAPRAPGDAIDVNQAHALLAAPDGACLFAREHDGAVAVP